MQASCCWVVWLRLGGRKGFYNNVTQKKLPKTSENKITPKTRHQKKQATAKKKKSIKGKPHFAAVAKLSHLHNPENQHPKPVFPQ